MRAADKPGVYVCYRKHEQSYNYYLRNHCELFWDMRKIA